MNDVNANFCRYKDLDDAVIFGNLVRILPLDFGPC